MDCSEPDFSANVPAFPGPSGIANSTGSTANCLQFASQATGSLQANGTDSSDEEDDDDDDEDAKCLWHEPQFEALQSRAVPSNGHSVHLVTSPGVDGTFFTEDANGQDECGQSQLMASRGQCSLEDAEVAIDSALPREQCSITSNGSKRSMATLGRQRRGASAKSSGSESPRVLPGTAARVQTASGQATSRITCRPISESSSLAQLSIASSCSSDPLMPMCKICHLNAKDGDPLISPCRCAGTMQFIHCGCLMKWLEISSKKTRKPLSCELCQYQYQWHKKFKVRHWQFPHCSRKDKVLHFIFFLSVLVMVGSAVVTVLCFKDDQERHVRLDPNRTELTHSEVITLICGVLFFFAFFMAMYVEVKARNTLYKLMVKFVYLNQQWYIDEYDKKDSQPVDV
ncbi:E3 ubiquitin-protein ligase MARCHF1 [Halotydeus destructor]|nr:E3 ubiquitin-protein ligase MARCHF1 [Halotydeus destructor]